MRINQKQSLFESFMDNVSNTKTLEGDNVNKFLKKYNSIYGDLPVVKNGKLYVDNIRLRGSGISKGIEATLQNGIMEVYNEEWGFTYDGSSISNMEDMSQYWFYNNYDTDEEFHKKIDSAAKSLYKDMQLLASSNLTEADDIDHIVQRGNVYIPVRKGETEEKAIKRAEDTTKPVESEKVISFKMPLYSKEFKDALMKDRDALIASYDESKVDPAEVSRKIDAGEELNSNEAMWFINRPPQPGSIILGDIVRKVASDGKWVDIDRYEDYEKDPVANADAAEELEECILRESSEAKDYTVTIGFLGGMDGGDCDGTKDYEVYAESRQDAVNQVLDNDDALAQYDLDIADIKKDSSGDWEVRVSFGEGDYNPGYHTYIFDGSLDEVSVKEAALDEARYDGDLYVEAVDGTPFDYEMGESAKIKESASDRYQVRKFTDEDKIDKRLAGADFGVYDTKENKFIQKGSKKVMIAACDDLNKKSLKESNIVWSSDTDGEEYDEGVWEVQKEDLESNIVPMIQSQTTDNIVFMCGTVGRWTGNHAGGLAIEVNDANDLLIGDDLDTINIFEDNGNLGWEGIHHDGSHEMYFYAMPSDEATREKLVRELGIVDWYKDIYSYDDSDKDALNDALSDLYSASRLNDILEPKDFAVIAQICQPIKWK